MHVEGWEENERGKFWKGLEFDVERLPKKTVQTICDGVDTVLNTVCGV